MDRMEHKMLFLNVNEKRIRHCTHWNVLIAQLISIWVIALNCENNSTKYGNFFMFQPHTVFLFFVRVRSLSLCLSSCMRCEWMCKFTLNFLLYAVAQTVLVTPLLFLPYVWRIQFFFTLLTYNSMWCSLCTVHAIHVFFRLFWILSSFSFA